MSSKPTLNPALKDFWKTKSRIKVLYGGRASSKTWDAAGVAVFLSQKYKLKFLCTRQYQNKISESVYATIKNQIERFGLTGQFDITNNRISHKTTGSEFIFLGLWRNIDEIKSLEGVDICWIEEAHGLTKEQWEILEPTIRKEGSEFWIVFNPRLMTDFVYKRFVLKTPPNTVVRKINHTENPFLSSTMKVIIEDMKLNDRENYDHVYEGMPKSEDVNSLFSYEEINQMNDSKRVIDESGNIVWGQDIARFGDDKCQLYKREGMRGQGFKTWGKLDTMKTADKIIGEFNVIYNKPDFVFVDVIGVGAGTFDRLIQLGLRNVVLEANASAKATNEIYFNKRTEMYFNLKDAIRKGFYTPEDEELAEELMAHTYVYTDKNQYKLSSKEEIKAVLGRSPDKADAVALSFFEILPPKIVPSKDQYAQTHKSVSVPQGAW